MSWRIRPAHHHSAHASVGIQELLVQVTLKEAKSASMNVSRNFLFSFLINLFTIAGNCTEK